MSKGRVIAVVNMKGGVGKTTTVVGIGETFAAKGSPVLVVDVDAQASASYCLAGDELLTELISTDRTVDALFDTELIENKRLSIQKLIRDQVSEVTHLGQNLSISLLASSANLRLTEREIICTLTAKGFSFNGVEGQTRALLSRHLGELRNSYSHIIFDCAPGISAFSTAAISLADLIIVPTLPDYLSHAGLTAFMKSVLTNIERERGRGTVAKPHVLITRKRNTTQHNQYHERIKAEAERPDAPFKLFETVVPEAAAWPNALAMINQYPTFSQKYPAPIGTILDHLTDEIEGAFSDGRH